MSSSSYYNPWSFSDDLEGARFQIDTSAIVTEMSRRVHAVEEGVLLKVIVARLEALGYTVIAP